MVFLKPLLCILALQFALNHAAEMEELFHWKEVQFKWPSDEIRDRAISAKAYIPEHNVPLGLSRWKNKMFISLNRWKTGVASALNYVEIGKDKSPLLIPYPTLEANLVWNTSDVISNKVEKPIVSVFRTFVDVCDRLWVVDDGVDDLFGNQQHVIDKSISIFDLNTNKLIRRYFFKKSDVREDSVFGNIAFAYVADFSGFGLVVYSFELNNSWRVRHLYMLPDPLAGTFRVGDVTAHWIDGVLGLALTEVKGNGHRSLYFHSLTSTTQFHVSTEVLKDEMLAKTADFDAYKVSGNRGPDSQSTSCAYDKDTGVIFYTQPNRNGVSCWNTYEKLNFSTDLVAKSDVSLEFPCDMKLDENRNVLVLSNRLPKYLYGSHDKNEVNIRVLKVKADDAILGTACHNPSIFKK